MCISHVPPNNLYPNKPKSAPHTSISHLHNTSSKVRANNRPAHIDGTINLEMIEAPLPPQVRAKAEATLYHVEERRNVPVCISPISKA